MSDQGDAEFAAAWVAGWLVGGAWCYERANLATGFVGPDDRRPDRDDIAARLEAIAELMEARR